MSHSKWKSFLLAALATFVSAAMVQGQQNLFLGKNAAAWESDLLDGKEPRIRRNAAFALGKLGNQAAGAIASLKKRLGDDSAAEVREAAAFALGEIGRESFSSLDDPDLVDVLAKALEDKEALVRRSAAYALGCLGTSAKGAQAQLEAILDDMSPGVRQNVAWALGRLGPATVPSLRKALKDPDLLVRRDAAGSLGQLKPEAARAALPELVACCAEKNSELRFAALTVLSKLVGPDDGKYAPPIRAALDDRDLEVKQNAALALSNIGGPEAAAAVPVLIDALKRGALDMQRQAAAGLRNIGPDAQPAVPILIRTLTAKDAELRRNAALALGGIGDKAEPAFPSLLAMLADIKEDRDVRIEAAVSLARISATPTGALDVAKKAVPTLLKILADPNQDARIRERIVWALRVHNIHLREMKGVFPTFAKILSEPKEQNNRMLRYDCAYMLGMLQGAEAPKSALDTLLDFLKDDSIVLFRNKSVSTVATGGEAGKGGPAKVTEEGAGDARVMAIQALTQIGAEVVASRKEIVQQLQRLAAAKDTFPDLREKTKELLKSIGK
jgi:HEAT repeat protein